jgi:hypothetical protein
VVFVITVISISSLGPLGLLGKFQGSAHCPAEQQFATTAQEQFEQIECKNGYVQQFY